MSFLECIEFCSMPIWPFPIAFEWDIGTNEYTTAVVEDINVISGILLLALSHDAVLAGGLWVPWAMNDVLTINIEPVTLVLDQ